MSSTLYFEKNVMSPAFIALPSPIILTMMFKVVNTTLVKIATDPNLLLN